MEHFPSPFAPEELANPKLGENLAFLAEVEAKAKQHRVFRHPFLQRIRPRVGFSPPPRRADRTTSTGQ